MKYLFLIFLTSSVFAGGWLPLERPGFVESNYPRLYEFENECFLAEGYQCFDVALCPTAICSVIPGPQVYDYTSKVGEVSCLDPADCDLKFQALTCAQGDPVKNYDSLSVYCAVDVMKAGPRILAIDQAKKTTYQAALAAKKAARDAKIAAKEANKAELFALKKADIDAMSVSQRNAVMVKLINIVQDIDQ